MSYLDNNGLTHFFDNLKNIFVPKSRKINNKTLDEDVTLSPSDIGAASSSDVAGVTSRVTTLENNANKHLDLTKTTTQTMSGALFVGGPNSNVGNAYTHQRKPTSGYISGKQVYGAAFAVDTSGRSTFQSKSYNDSGASGVNDAVLRFSKDGIQFAKNSTTGNVPAETDYKELATQEWVTSQTSPKLIVDDYQNITFDSVQQCITQGVDVIAVRDGTHYRLMAKYNDYIYTFTAIVRNQVRFMELSANGWGSSVNRFTIATPDDVYDIVNECLDEVENGSY